MPNLKLMLIPDGDGSCLIHTAHPFKDQQMMNQFDWQGSLEQMFSATVNQDTLDDAATLMVSVSSVDAEYHDECVEVLDRAGKLALEHDQFLINCINKSGYRADNFEEAASIIEELKAKYLAKYHEAVT